MSTRRAKQLIYGTLYVLILLAVCFAFYDIVVRPFMPAPAVVCTASTCAPTSTAPLAASIVGVFTTGGDNETFLAQVTNADADFGAPSFNYDLNLYDASGTALGSLSGQSFIYAGENKYVLVPNVAVGSSFDHAVLTIASADWTPSSTLGAAPGVAPGGFSLENVVPQTASTTISVSGQLANTGVAAYSQVMVLVLFKDINGAIVGGSQTELDNVAPGATTEFSVIYPNESSAVNPALNQIIVYAKQ